MKKFIKRLLAILIILVGLVTFFKIRETLGLGNILDSFSRHEKTDNIDILRDNLEKEAHKDDKASWLYENFDSLSQMEKNLVGNDPDTIDFVYNNKNNITDFAYEEGVSKDYGRSTPFYLQWDNRWAYRPLSSSNIGYAGCGPTSMAMVLSRLENNPSITPLVIAKDAESYMDENGISWKFFTDEAYKYQRSIDNIPLNEDYMIDALDKGPLVISVGPGYFTLQGHIMVIDSYDKGKFVINDPNSIKNSDQSWSFSQLEDQILNIWLIY